MQASGNLHSLCRKPATAADVRVVGMTDHDTRRLAAGRGDTPYAFLREQGTIDTASALYTFFKVVERSIITDWNTADM